jgi:hypothetical protein
MNLKSYLDLYELLKNDVSSREERRAFGLSYGLGKSPLDQVITWTSRYYKKLKSPLLSETFSSYMYGVTMTLVIIAFFLGVFSGITLLSYNGHEPVNVVYFMAMVIVLPLFTMLLTVLSMIRSQSAQSILVHISPAYWLEKMLGLLPNAMQKSIETFKINPLLSNWIVIKRSQLLAIFFSLGLLLSLLAVVATKDIAFAWSTTLQITPEVLHRYLNLLAFPWREFIPTAVPSLELIEQSQYFRLGDSLSDEMIHNASKLGEWWRFLVFATLFYAMFLRFVLYLVSLLGYHLALQKSLMGLEGVNTLLRDMNEPIISTHALHVEKISSAVQKNIQHIQKLDTSYDVVQGWAIPLSKLTVVIDSMEVITPNILEVGGGNTLEEDSEIVHKSFGEVLLYVKAWEPPTMDFLDYLEILLESVDKVIVCPIGTEEESYKAKAKWVDIWVQKLSLLHNKKLWVKI